MFFSVLLIVVVGLLWSMVQGLPDGTIAVIVVTPAIIALVVVIFAIGVIFIALVVVIFAIGVIFWKRCRNDEHLVVTR